MNLSETELLLRSNDFQENLTTQVILKFMRDPGLTLAELGHQRGIDTMHAVPIIEVTLDEKTPKLKYVGPMLVDKWEGLAEAIFNYLTRHIRNMHVCHKDTISHLDFGYTIVLDFYNSTLEDVLAHDLAVITLAQKVLKNVVVGLILFHTEKIFHGDIKPWSIMQRGSLWKINDLQSSRKIGDTTHNAEKYNWGYFPP